MKIQTRKEICANCGHEENEHFGNFERLYKNKICKKFTPQRENIDYHEKGVTSQNFKPQNPRDTKSGSVLPIGKVNNSVNKEFQVSPDKTRGIFSTEVSHILLTNSDNVSEIKDMRDAYEKGREHERQRLKAEVEKAINERIKNYKKLYNKTKNKEFLAKWETMVELKQKLGLGAK